MALIVERQTAADRERMWWVVAAGGGWSLPLFDPCKAERSSVMSERCHGYSIPLLWLVPAGALVPSWFQSVEYRHMTLVCVCVCVVSLYFMLIIPLHNPFFGFLFCFYFHGSFSAKSGWNLRFFSSLPRVFANNQLSSTSLSLTGTATRQPDVHLFNPKSLWMLTHPPPPLSPFFAVDFGETWLR